MNVRKLVRPWEIAFNDGSRDSIESGEGGISPQSSFLTGFLKALLTE